MEQQKGLFKYGAFLLILTNLGNVLALLYHFFMTQSHYLSVEEYGVLGTLLNLINILNASLGSIQLITAQKISAAFAQRHTDQARQISLYILKKVSWVGIITTALFILLIPFLKSYLKIDSSILFYIVGLTFFLSFIYPVILGTFQGMQDFVGLGVNSFFSSVAKLGIALGLVMMGFGVKGALFAIPGFLLFSILLGLFVLRRTIFTKESIFPPNPTALGKIFEHIFPTVVALLLYSFLSLVDSMIVKHYKTADEAGLYQAISMLGKSTFLFVPAAFVQVMLPKVSGVHAIKQNPRHLLDKTILYTFFICLMGILICAISPARVLRLATGTKYLEAAPLLPLFAIAITPLALSNIFLNYQLARLKTRFIVSFLVITILHTTLLVLFHDQFYHILLVIWFSGCLIFAWNYYLVSNEVAATD